MLAACGCGRSDGGGGGHPRSAHAFAYRSARYGYRVTIPDGWQRARTSLTPHLTDPHEILAAASFRPSTREEDCAQFPTAALHHMPRDGVLVEVQERAGRATSEFVKRPAHFTAASGSGQIEVVDCVPKPPAFCNHLPVLTPAMFITVASQSVPSVTGST